MHIGHSVCASRIGLTLQCSPSQTLVQALHWKPAALLNQSRITQSTQKLAASAGKTFCLQHLHVSTTNVHSPQTGDEHRSHSSTHSMHTVAGHEEHFERQRMQLVRLQAGVEQAWVAASSQIGQSIWFEREGNQAGLFFTTSFFKTLCVFSMSINKDWAPAELLRIIVCLRHGYARSKEDASNKVDTRVLDATDFEACNGKPHKDKKLFYDRRRMEKYALHTLNAWCEYATSKGKSGNKPPSTADWRTLGTLLENFNNETGYESDDDDVDGLDGEASEDDEEEEEEGEEEGDEPEDEPEDKAASDAEDDDDEEDEYKPEEEEEEEEDDDDDDEDDDDASADEAEKPSRKRVRAKKASAAKAPSEAHSDTEDEDEKEDAAKEEAPADDDEAPAADDAASVTATKAAPNLLLSPKKKMRIARRN